MSDLAPQSEFITFETNLPAPYNLNEPRLRELMIQKIEKNVTGFGSFEKWLETFTVELEHKRIMAERAVQVWYTNQKQMDFLREYAEHNVTKSDPGLDIK